MSISVVQDSASLPALLEVDYTLKTKLKKVITEVYINMRLIKVQPKAAEKANKIMLDFLLREGMDLSDDKDATLAIACIDLFYDWAVELENLN